MANVRSRFVRAAHIAAALSALSLAACGGGGGDSGGGGGGTSVAISGTIAFERIPFSQTLIQGLSPASTVQSPARQVLVEAIDATSGQVLASTTTDTAGAYSVTVPASRNLFIRAKAQMLKTDAAPTWNFSVLNNTNSDALYVLDGGAASSGTVNSTRNLLATSGWGGTSYTGPRTAAPFAILDTVYSARQLILAAAANAVFPQLALYWSSSNRASIGAFCPDLGNIGTTFYVGSGEQDQCAVPKALPAGIYVLGDYANGAGDTDEFDQNVIAHEFGHYVENNFSRSDSIGGSHSTGDKLDLRVAYSEGWGNAYSTMVLNDPLYRDSFAGISRDFSFNLQTDLSNPRGWFSEASVGQFFWYVFSPVNGSGLALGFAPIFAVLSGPQKTTNALTSIYTFATQLRVANPQSAAGIATLLNNHLIFGADEFGANETSNGGDPTALPVYVPMVPTGTVVCSTTTAGSQDANKLGNRKFLRFDNAVSGLVTIQAVGVTNSLVQDPDIFVHQQGQIVASGTVANSNTETISQKLLAAGTYIIEVYDFNVTGTNAVPRCMNVTIQGP